MGIGPMDRIGGAPFEIRLPRKSHVFGDIARLQAFAEITVLCEALLNIERIILLDLQSISFKFDPAIRLRRRFQESCHREVRLDSVRLPIDRRIAYDPAGLAAGAE